MVLGKRFPCEHIGVAIIRPRKKAGHLEDRTLFDVTKEKNFDKWLKGIVT